MAQFTAAGVAAFNFGPGMPELAHQVDEHCSSRISRPRACAQLEGVRSARGARMNPVTHRTRAGPLHPLLTGGREYPFVTLEKRRAGARARRRPHHQFRHGRSARAHARVHPRGAARAPCPRCRATRRRSARPSCARACARWLKRRFGVEARSRAPRAAGERHQGGGVQPRDARSIADGRRCAAHGGDPDARLPGVRVGRAIRGRRSAPRRRCAPRTAGASIRAACRTTCGRAPRCCGSARRTIRPARCSASPR